VCAIDADSIEYARAASGFLPTHDILGQTSDIVLSRHRPTTWQVMTYDVDIRYRVYPTYDVATYDFACLTYDPATSYV
jgi:hypothetical protein